MASFEDFLKIFKDTQGIDQPAVTIPYRKEDDLAIPPIGVTNGGQQEVTALPRDMVTDPAIMSEPTVSPQAVPEIISKLKAVAGASRSPAVVPQGMAPSAVPTDLTDKIYADAQAKAKDNRKYAELLAAGNQAAAGIASLGAGSQVKVDPSGQQMLMNSADAPIKDVEASRKQEKEFLDLMDDKKKNDPNSEASKLYRETFKKLGVKIGDNATAAELEKAAPTITTAINAQLAREAQQLRMAEIAESRAERNASKKTELDDKYMAKFNDTINKFEKEKVEGDKYFDTALSLADEATRSPTAAINLARSLIKSIEGAGARVSDKDIQTTLRAGGVSDIAISRLQEAETGTIPEFQAKDVTKLMKVMKEISDKKFNERKEQMIYRQAKLLNTTPDAIKEATFMPETKKEVSDTVKVVLPNGKTGTIPRANLEAAKKQGAKEI